MEIKLLADEFYFARHGQTDNNARGLVTGRLDIPLDETGISQAAQMAAFVSRLPFASCVCSPMDRAFVTAELLLAGREDVIPVPLAGLEERGWGELEGTHKDHLDRYEFVSKGVEEWESFVQRVMDCVLPVSLPAPVFIVAHSGTFRALCEILKVDTLIRPVKNASPYRFYRIDEKWYVEDCAEVM